jgi:DNA-binding NtrC family response regulator
MVEAKERLGSEPTPRILIVDDDRAVRTVLKVNLSKQGYDVTACSGAKEAMASLKRRAVDLVITDVSMAGMSGLELLAHLKTVEPDVRVVVMTGFGSIDDAVQAMKVGADDYIIKPVTKEALLVIVERALSKRAMLAELHQLRKSVDEKYGFDSIIGATPAMIDLFEQIEAVADTGARVLLQGATGTGKELLANAIHRKSARHTGPFIRVNCAALPENLLETELFGHEKGAFTGAIRQHRGKFEQAHNGTIFLDEIGEISPVTQAKLLRVLESGEFQRVGGTESLIVDVRIVSATNRNLREEVDAGNFREDLFYRLNVFCVDVPSLIDRMEDVPLLVAHFVEKYAKDNNRPSLTIPTPTMARLIGYAWPGNVRELQHVIERAVILSRGSVLTGVILPKIKTDPNSKTELMPIGMSLQAGLLEYERKVIIEALKRGKGVQAVAARQLGISRSNLNYRINKLNISVKSVVYE